VQPSPDGLAQAYLLARDFLAGAPSAMVLGDNIFFGHGLPELLAAADRSTAGGTVFGYRVADPERYGVVDFGPRGEVRGIIEKPAVPPSPYAVTGLYFLDGSAPERAARVRPSARGELEITSLLESYLVDGSLDVQKMGRGFAWLDRHPRHLDAGNFVAPCRGCRPARPTRSPMRRAGSRRSSSRIVSVCKNAYGEYLKSLL
jgi:glucose-1-phosphate thymidylyltransferase